jgi:hypothetical protein
MKRSKRKKNAKQFCEECGEVHDENEMVEECVITAAFIAELGFEIIKAKFTDLEAQMLELDPGNLWESDAIHDENS